MPVLSLLKRTGKACITFVTDGIDYACYIVEEFRNPDKNRSEWHEGELSKPIGHQITSVVNAQTHTGKINVRLGE